MLVSSTKVDGIFFSVAKTTPFVALIPNDVAPAVIAAKACLIWTSSPDGENVVNENEYLLPLIYFCIIGLSFFLLEFSCENISRIKSRSISDYECVVARTLFDLPSWFLRAKVVVYILLTISIFFCEMEK